MGLLNPDDEDWMVSGVCRNHDPELWWAKLQNEKATRKAKTLCSLCPVRVQCLHYAVKYNQISGTWGGLTALERKRLSQASIRIILRGEDVAALPDASHWEHCGTPRGASRHRRRKERVCHSCRAADSRRTQKIKKEKKRG